MCCASAAAPAPDTTNTARQNGRRTKNPNVNKYLNKANTVVAAVDSFIMIMRCDLTLRSIWFLFVVIVSDGSAIVAVAVDEKKGTNFQDELHHAANTEQDASGDAARSACAHFFISFSVRLIHSADVGVHACVRRMRLRAVVRSTYTACI